MKDIYGKDQKKLIQKLLLRLHAKGDSWPQLDKCFYPESKVKGTNRYTGFRTWGLVYGGKTPKAKSMALVNKRSKIPKKNP